MNYRVYNESKGGAVLLKLSEEGDGSVLLKVVDSRGEDITDGVVLSIDSTGKIVIWEGLNPDTGFQQDETGHAIVEYE
jgi:hypothetical protein